MGNYRVVSASCDGTQGTAKNPKCRAGFTSTSSGPARFRAAVGWSCSGRKRLGSELPPSALSEVLHLTNANNPAERLRTCEVSLRCPGGAAVLRRGGDVPGQGMCVQLRPESPVIDRWCSYSSSPSASACGDSVTGSPIPLLGSTSLTIPS